MNQERELTVVDSPEFSDAARGQEPRIDGAAELPAPPAGEELESPAGESGAAEPGALSAAEQLKAERDQLLDRLARLQAEFENARKRAERERAEFREFVTGQVVEQFLPVLDNFELALKAKGSEKQLRSGVELIVKQMEEVLQKMQVSVIPTVGEAFDPRIHEAMGAVECDDLPDQHVAEEVRRGYRIRERLLRPALVKVAHNNKQVDE
jgi:molecular chaperone GrpE